MKHPSFICSTDVSTLHVVLLAQAEVMLHFFMGTLDISDTYCDDMRTIAFKYVTAPTGFWLDLITSLPWSFNDLYSTLVQYPIDLSSMFSRLIVNMFRQYCNVRSHIHLLVGTTRTHKICVLIFTSHLTVLTCKQLFCWSCS